MKLGVGIVGAGPATQAIHLPTLARLPDLFYVASVMDVDAELAASVAQRVHATPEITVEALLANSAVDVVAICSPDRFHADQIAASCRARKLGVLCEKPLATSTAEADEIVAAVTQAEIPLVVGTMRAYDPVWLEFYRTRKTVLQSARLIRSTLTYPFNTLLEDYASEIIGRAKPGPTASAAIKDARTACAHLRDLTLSLWIHDLPLIRSMVPTIPRVEAASVVHGSGGVVALAAGGVRVQLVAYAREVWHPDWRFEAWGDDWRLRVDVPPSYVHAGSARISMSEEAGKRVFGPSQEDGYVGEWRELHRLVTVGGEPQYSLSSLRDDLAYATAIADAAVAQSRNGGTCGGRG